MDALLVAGLKSPPARVARWRGAVSARPPRGERVVVVCRDRDRVERAAIAFVNTWGEWRESEHGNALSGEVAWWIETPERAPEDSTLRARAAALLRRYRDAIAIVLLMLGVALIVEAYTQGGAYSRSRLDPLGLALGVGAVALAWIVYRGPRK